MSFRRKNKIECFVYMVLITRIVVLKLRKILRVCLLKNQTMTPTEMFVGAQ